MSEQEFYVRKTPARDSKSGNIEIEFRREIDCEVGEPHKVEKRLRVKGNCQVILSETDPLSIEAAQIVVEVERVELRILGGSRLTKSWVPLDETYVFFHLTDELGISVQELARADWLCEQDLADAASIQKQLRAEEARLPE